MKRIWSIILLTAIFLCLLTGCGGSSKQITGDEVAKGLKTQGIVGDTLDIKQSEKVLYEGKTGYEIEIPVNHSQSNHPRTIGVSYYVNDTTKKVDYFSIICINFDEEKYDTQFQLIFKKSIMVLDSKLKETEVDKLVRDLTPVAEDAPIEITKNKMKYRVEKSSISTSVFIFLNSAE